MAADAARAFIDSTVLIYLASADPIKAEKTEGVLAAGGVISVLVLNEIANVSWRKISIRGRTSTVISEPSAPC